MGASAADTSLRRSAASLPDELEGHAEGLPRPSVLRLPRIALYGRMLDAAPLDRPPRPVMCSSDGRAHRLRHGVAQGHGRPSPHVIAMTNWGPAQRGRRVET